MSVRMGMYRLRRRGACEGKQVQLDKLGKNVEILDVRLIGFGLINIRAEQ